MQILLINFGWRFSFGVDMLRRRIGSSSKFEAASLHRWILRCGFSCPLARGVRTRSAETSPAFLWPVPCTQRASEWAAICDQRSYFRTAQKYAEKRHRKWWYSEANPTLASLMIILRGRNNVLLMVCYFFIHRRGHMIVCMTLVLDSIRKIFFEW